MHSHRGDSAQGECQHRAAVVTSSLWRPVNMGVEGEKERQSCEEEVLGMKTMDRN